MKKKMMKLIAAILVIGVLLSTVATGVFAADDLYEVKFTVNYHQTEAREMIDSLNQLRTAETLSEVAYDYELEGIAMERAAEIILANGYQSPDGRWYDKGNNVISESHCRCAKISDAQSTISSLKATKDAYLNKDAVAVGMACVEYEGNFYVVWSFSDIIGDMAKTTALNGNKDVAIKVYLSNIEIKSGTPAVKSISMTYGDEEVLPSVNAKYSVKGSDPYSLTFDAVIKCDWESENSSVAKIEDGKVKGVGAGQTNIKVKGTETKVPVTVSAVSLDDAVITLDKTEYNLTGSAVEPIVKKVLLNGKELKKGEDFTVKYSDNTKVGTGVVTITGIGNYKGTASTKFTIAVSCEHKNVKTLAKVEPTCTKDGKTEGKQCSDCKVTLVAQEIIPRLGHEEGEWEIVTEPTATKDGKKVLKCKRCGQELKTQKIDHTTTLATPVITASNVASSGKIKISWSKVTNAVSYDVYRYNESKGEWVFMKNTMNLSYTNTSAVAGTKYKYKMQAVAANENIKSEFSKSVSRTCDLATPVMTLKSNSDGKTEISWEKVKNAASYDVYRATSKTGTYKKLTNTKDLSFEDYSGKAGTKYYYKVRAVHTNTDANSQYCSPKYRITKVGAPSIKAAYTAKGKPTISWQKVEGAEKYKVYRATAINGTYKLMLTTTNLKYTNTSATSGMNYYYYVKAVGPGKTTSIASNTVSVVAK